MAQTLHDINKINFTTHQLILENSGAFECTLSTTPEFDGSVVIDIYVLDNPIHPDGHIGWWQFSIDHSTKKINGTITCTNGTIECMLSGHAPIQTWVNTDLINGDKLIINAVLRNNITNAIIYLDKIPAFNHTTSANDYRTTFNRDWNTPRFAITPYIFPKESTIRIVSRNIFTRDAVGNLCLSIYRMLRQNNIPVELYCYDTDLALNDFVRRIDHLTIDAKTNDQLLYFYSIYDANLEDILKIKFKQRIAYFHGITKPELLQVFDPELSVNCLKGLNQLKELQQFDVLAANSRASATTLISKFNNPALNINDITIIPPKLLEPKPALPIEDTSSQKKSPITKMLYVGRIKSNKKIEHLLFLFSEYQKLDPSAELWILGNNSDKAYSDYLNWVQEKQFKLPHNKVHWLGSVNDEELHQHYTSATVYVSMSEDEGFCLPILEAMLHNLPVFTYALPAIQEVMQDTGFIFGEKDFNHLAKNLFSLLSDSSKIKQITSKQRTRANQLATQMDGSTFLKLLSTTFLSKIS